MVRMNTGDSPGSPELPLQTASGAFFVEFSTFETASLGAALRSLSRDAAFVEQAHRILDLEARLKLLERMAFARGVSGDTIQKLKSILIRARVLVGRRDTVAANLAERSPFIPAVARVKEYAAEAIALQDAMRDLTRRIDAESITPATLS